MLPDVDERHVPAPERDQQDDRGHQGHRERREERVLGRQGQPSPSSPRRVRARDQRIEDEAEGEEERGAPEGGHQVFEDLAGA